MGLTPVLSPPVWEAALKQCIPSGDYRDLVEDAEAAFTWFARTLPSGLGCLPPCWLAALPGLLGQLARQHPSGRIPLTFTRLAVHDGLLQITFRDEDLLQPLRPERRSLCMRVRRVMNLGLYPSLFRPLKPQHQSFLDQERLRWMAPPQNRASSAATLICT
jgi:hypothetical protein